MVSIYISQANFFCTCGLLFIFLRCWKLVNLEVSINWRQESVKILFGVYLILLISVIFFPVLFQFGPNKVVNNPVIWLNPVSSFLAVVQQGVYVGAKNIIGNAILLTPLTVFMLIFYNRWFKCVWVTVIFAFCVSFGIESLQFVESTVIAGVGRFTEINDLLLNTLSGWFGYIIYKKLEPIINKWI